MSRRYRTGQRNGLNPPADRSHTDVAGLKIKAGPAPRRFNISVPSRLTTNHAALVQARDPRRHLVGSSPDLERGGRIHTLPRIAQA